MEQERWRVALRVPDDMAPAVAEELADGLDATLRRLVDGMPDGPVTLTLTRGAGE